MNTLRRTLAALCAIAAALVLGSCASEPVASIAPGTVLEEVQFERPAKQTLTTDAVKNLLNEAYIAAGSPPGQEALLAEATAIIGAESGNQVAMLKDPLGAGPLPDGSSDHAARGLGALLPATFAAYHQEGTSWNIYDPLANTSALLAYLAAR